MTIFIYLGVLITAVYWVVKTLAPEMAKPPVRSITPQPETYNAESNEPEDRISKLESLLAEKNRNIFLLQKELKIFYVQVCEFEKIKTLFEDEIHRLKEQNRMFRSELGLPSVSLSGSNSLDREKSNTDPVTK